MTIPEVSTYKDTVSLRDLRPFTTGIQGAVHLGMVRIYDNNGFHICEVWARQGIADDIARAMNFYTGQEEE